MATKVELSCEALRAPLEQAAAAANPKGIEILGCALVEIDEDAVTVTCCDTERQIVARQQAMGGAGLRFCVPARRLLDGLKLIALDAGLSLLLGAEQLTVKHAAGSMRLPVRRADEFPAFEREPPEHCLRLPAGEFKQALRQVSPAMASKDVRYYFNGLLVDATPAGVVLVATNGHRLHKRAIEGRSERSIEAIVPRQSALDLIRFLPDSQTEIELQIGTTTLSVTLWAVQFATRLIVGRYPNWRRAVVDDGVMRAVVEREGLLLAINRARVLSERELQPLVLRLGDDRLRLRADDGETGTAAEAEIEAVTTGAIETGFSAAYLIDALNACDAERVQLRFGDYATGGGVYVTPDGEGESPFGAYVCQLRL